MNMETRKKRSRKNPVETSNFLSRLFLTWTVPIFWKGARGDLHFEDLRDPLKSHESQRLGDCLEREWKKELARAEVKPVSEKCEKPKLPREPNLMWAIARMFWVPFTLHGLCLLFEALVLQLMRPILQGLIIRYFDPNENLITSKQVLVYAGLLVMLTFCVVLILQWTLLQARKMGMCVRIACCSMIYRKVLRLNQAALNNTAAGQITNLMSNDVARFDNVFILIQYVWIALIQGPLIGYIMWRSVGLAACVGIGTMIVQTIPIQLYMSSLSAKLRSKIAVKTDERVQLMSELLSGMQAMKMYSWEKPFELMVSRVRKLEIKLIAYTSYLKIFGISSSMFTDKFSLYLTLITFVLMGNALSVETTFELVGFFAILQKTFNTSFTYAIIAAGETSVSLKRITKFMLLDEMELPEKDESTREHVLQNTEPTEISPMHIQIVNVTANWVHNQLPPTLRDVSIDIRNQSLCALVGPVGSGKSSLLHLLLGELPIQTGRLSLSTNKTSQTNISRRDIRISYASQDPWLFAATIRDNILFEQPYDETRYKKVTRVCALHKDFDQLPQGDMTFVGERGSALSGGQKARVNLARAVYKDAELYMLDDPLSAVDARVSRHLFEECITGFLKNKTRILVTHQLRYLRQADSVVVINRGTVECQGTFEELEQKNCQILNFTDPKNPDKVENTEENQKKEPKIKAWSRPKIITAAIISNDNNYEEEVPEYNERSKDTEAAETMTGTIPSKVYRDYFLAGGNICSLVFLAIVFIAGQVASSGTDYWVSYWSKQETLRTKSQLNESHGHDADGVTHRNQTASGHRENFFTFSGWFDDRGLLHQSTGIYIYTVILISCILLIILRAMLLARMCMRASHNIHDSMYTNLLTATMRFFDANPSGEILNRFTKDLGTMDELLPSALTYTIQNLTILMGIFALIIIANYWMVLALVFMFGLPYVLRFYYIKTAKDIKRFESIAKSPMFSQTNSTLDGLTTIRSRGSPAMKLLHREFDSHQDKHTSAWYLSLVTASVFGSTIDLISCFFITCICFSFILIDVGDTLGGLAGLAISQSLLLTGMVQFGVKQSTEVISYMTSVERILQYTKLPQERPLTTDNPPPPTWPSRGALTFKDVSMRYADHMPLVLKNLNFDVHPRWKVGIVGRTGAGKSSIIAALFRLTGDGLDGEIVLDGINTKLIGLHELRPHISIIPQEPVLLTASLRHNLDPFGQYSDAELWSSLREVELNDIVSSLDFQVAGGGANFSVGQRQLICLARAILRNNRLLVLDEATANVDHATDTLIQKTIRRRFADCTVLTIAHRLNTIMHSDRVLVMRDGSIVEFGHPYLLLKNLDGHFSQMLRQTGNNAEKLAAIAENSYRINPEFQKQSGNTSFSTSE